MSLISAKNFISPFTNTVHLVTIVLVTLLFALFRLQGGGVAISYKDRSNAPLIERRPADQIDSLIIERSPAPARAIPAPRNEAARNDTQGTIEISREEGDLLREMIGKKPLVAAETENKQRTPPAKSSGALDEIAESLGLP